MQCQHLPLPYKGLNIDSSSTNDLYLIYVTSDFQSKPRMDDSQSHDTTSCNTLTDEDAFDNSLSPVDASFP
jgi:hypothetical protein